MKHLVQQALNVPLQKDFVSKVLQEQLDAKEGVKIPVFHFPLKETQDLPFHVSRSAYGSLPVYLDYKNGRTKTITIVRKIKGDLNKLKDDISKITGEEVTLRAGDQLEVKGNHARILRLYLRAVGF
ncbi:hypothetical protein C9374_008909 [Naegleria lovaniensis]|uniref:Large ribosomal subunit protein mL49 n=1 Tax=Naegleria lovaniensis TaxID=51637 RepID=A0AA88GHY5_NAELO|nr:uncharacterized protein C9374_008909 [Naegleria lovaniensis]KAG2377824.1 hypothetical protein C9374_008909 [Naegleria lovaniensis]